MMFIVLRAEKEENNLQNILVMRDFPDLFSTNYAGLAPRKEVEFRIECIPSTSPILNASYMVPPMEVKELKT